MSAVEEGTPPTSAALRAELEGMKLRALQKRAEELGVDQSQLDEAEDKAQVEEAAAAQRREEEKEGEKQVIVAAARKKEADFRVSQSAADRRRREENLAANAGSGNKKK